MDDKSLQMLEFPRIREILASFTSFSASRELALGLMPQHDHGRISRLLNQTEEARRLIDAEHGFNIGGVLDIGEAARMAALDSVLEPPSFLEIQQTLGALHQLRRSLSPYAEDYPLLWEIVGNIVELKQLEKNIARCIDISGEVRDTASPALATIRQQLRETRRQITERLEAVINSPKGRRLLQEDIITEREGRYVVLVKTECRHELKGIVHDISNTGATVFMEPTVTVGLGNALRELVAEEKHEVEKILRALSAEVGEHEGEINKNIALAAELDLALAKARYAQRLRAVEPDITDESQGYLIKLIEARHPLLGEKAVPFSLEMGQDFSVLVITGPNTGGKTVTLKTIGLLSLMAQAGMAIPASGESRLPIFDSIFADIGDEQSIEQTISSFSWHMGNIVRIIRGATGRSLVLLDELGTSTDPAEGSALARAILHSFLARGTLTAATTHYSDLKAFAHITPGFENASLEFDPVTLAPTYRLTVGLPGGSNAMATAARLGLPAEIISEARGMLTEGSQELESLLASLMKEKQQLASLHRELAAEKDRLARQNAELEKARQKLKDEEVQAIREARDQIVREAAGLHKELRQAAAKLRKEKSAAGVEEARQVLATVQQQLDSEAWQTPASPAAEGGVALKVGDNVWIKEAGLTATVLSISGETREVEVQAGRTRMRLGQDGVEKTLASPNIPPPSASIRTPVTRTTPLELDLRGKRADEVEPMLDSYLNAAARDNISEARIIHGFGTGTVRSIVRDFLASHPLVKSFRSGERGEGGDGVTIVRL